ncbi:uncharacterized protein F5147DRAFT_721869 [Suillus discolor]|uniref:C2H2-type domain-containing protein n=1 Tax=Suillus discolor TaxID=1912936 RepID=A0A9P7EWA3_9AGAM|nr:uncharacterized protein F5147DRAFT_721869 [Suillus discolor]KAG2092821.1 hypothetical protein F5147DRAFT_721869 [Suillus discolor]
MNSSTSTLQNPSFSQPGQAPDQQSTRLVLQSYLQCLDRLDRLERRVHEEIQEIRSLFRNILDNYQSNVTMEDSGGCDSTVDSQAGLDGLNVITPFGSSHDRYFMPQPAPHEASFGVMGSLSESIEGLLLNGTHGFANYVTPQHSMYSEGFPAFCDPRVTESSLEPEGVKSRLGFSLHGTIDSIYEPAPQPFQSVYLEEHVPSDSLVGPDAQLPVLVMQASQAKDRVKCTQDGCSAILNKDNLTRHVKEVHERKFKAVFKRSYQMNEHILRTRCGRF